MAELNTLIDEIVQKKFVSLEAADAIAAIKRRAEELEASNKKLSETQTRLLNEKGELEGKLVAVTTERDAMKAREAAVETREREALKNELKATHEAEKAAMAERLFMAVFRNAEVRREMVGSRPVRPGGSSTYPVNMPVNETVKHTTE